MKHNWTYKKLNEVCEKASSNIALNKIENNIGEYPLYGASGLVKHIDFYHKDKPYIGIIKDGAGVGRVGKYPAKSSLVGTMQYIHPNEEICNIDYLYFALQSLHLNESVTGATIPHIYFKDYGKLSIPIPSLDEQQAIVRELDGINHLIDLQEEQLREYDRLAQSLFYTTFGDPVSNPKGWEVKKLGDIAEPTTGITYSPDDVADDGIIVLRSSNIQDNKLDFDDIVRVRKTVAEKYYVKAGDILMCSRNGSFRLVGKTALVDNLNEKMTWGAFMTIIRSDYNPYLLQYFRTPAFREQLTTAKTTTVNQITIGMLKKIQLPIPPANVQQTFAAQIEAIEQQKALIRRSLDETRTLLAARMQYYFNS